MMSTRCQYIPRPSTGVLRAGMRSQRMPTAGEDEHGCDAPDQMQRVQTSGGKVKVKEKLGGAGLQRKRRPDARHQALRVLRMVLVALDAEEHEPEGGGAEQPPDGARHPALARRGHGERHGQAAGQQDHGVEAADPEVKMPAGLLRNRLVGDAEDEDAHEDAAEQHDLGGEEHPHAEQGRLVLLGGLLIRLDDVRPVGHGLLPGDE